MSSFVNVTSSRGRTDSPRFLGSHDEASRRSFLNLAGSAAALPAILRIARADSYPSRPVRCRQGQRHRTRVSTPSVRGYMREFNDFCPFVCIIGDQFTKFGRRHRHRGYAQLDKKRL
jgi:hypothetical protein